ncbi:MAG: hypothetical protein OXL68_20695 [Paracoccaceae bacterium]|nr:hypothetical protein [Paracoccaceae bacterium]
MWLDVIRDLDKASAVYITWKPVEHSPTRPSGQDRMAEPGMLSELIVAAAV